MTAHTQLIQIQIQLTQVSSVKNQVLLQQLTMLQQRHSHQLQILLTLTLRLPTAGVLTVGTSMAIRLVITILIFQLTFLCQTAITLSLV